MRWKCPRIQILAMAVAFLWLGGCDKQEKLPAGQIQPTTVVCIDCGKPSSLELTNYAAHEKWPKECPSCHKQSVYASTPCSHCRKPVPMKDPKTGGYGIPATCPDCGKRWEP